MNRYLPRSSKWQALGPQMSLLLVLSASSALSILIWVMRVFYSGRYSFMFLVWNLFLAWVPLFCALALWRYSQRPRPAFILNALLLAGWLAFLPNAPYLVTDLLHLAQRHNVPLWYDLILLFTFAWNGLIVGFTSLWIVQEVLQRLYGAVVAWLAIFFSLAASGFGVYLGRFLRWNSWDVLANPQWLAYDILVRLVDPFSHPRTVVVTLLFAGFLTLAYLTLVLLARTRWAEQPVPSRHQ